MRRARGRQPSRLIVGRAKPFVMLDQKHAVHPLPPQHSVTIEWPQSGREIDAKGCANVSLSTEERVRAPFILAGSPRMGIARAGEAAIPPSLLDQATKLLAELIQSSREAAISAGVKSVPPQIHRALLGFFPDAILRKTRYTSPVTPTPSLSWASP